MFFTPGTDPAWERCAEHFLQHLFDKSGSEKTVRSYRYQLHLFFGMSANGGDAKRPDEYTREDVAAFLHLERQGPNYPGGKPSVSTVNQRLIAITSFYKFAAAYTITGDDGKPRVLFGALPPTTGMCYGKPKRVYRAMSYEEMERLFAVIPTNTVRGLRDRAIFLFFLYTARRREEVCQLTWGNLEEGVIVDADGGRRPGWLYHFRGKGHKQQDDVAELPGPAKEALDRYLTTSGRMEQMTPDSPLFIATKGPVQGPLNSRHIAKLLKQYVRAAGLDEERISLHTWRHTSTQQRYQAGEDIRSLQRLLRHTSIATTDTYLRGLTGTADPGAKLIESKFARFTQ